MPDNTSVDLANLRELTGGDTAVEKELFQVFMAEGANNAEGLRSAAAANDNGEWRRYAHAFKGISRNLGAVRLGELCFEAQQNFEEGAAEKAKMLAGIEAEFSAVKAFLRPFL